MSYYLYLGGPIKGGSYEEVNAWRELVSEQLKPYDIICLSPMRWRSHRKAETEMKDGYPNDVMMSPAGVKARDKFDVRRSDALLFNLLGAKTVSIGTCVEYGWGGMLEKPIITVIEEKDNPHEHSFILESADYRVTALESGISVAKMLLSPER